MSPFKPRLALAAVLVTVLATGCGESDSNEDPEVTEKGQVARVVETMYRDLSAADADGVCAVMSDAARRQIARKPPGGGAPGTCEESFSAFLDAAARSGVLERTRNPRVDEVVIRGPRATVTVSFDGTPGGRIGLLKEDGQWRFGSGPLGPTS